MDFRLSTPVMLKHLHGRHSAERPDTTPQVPHPSSGAIFTTLNPTPTCAAKQTGLGGLAWVADDLAVNPSQMLRRHAAKQGWISYGPWVLLRGSSLTLNNLCSKRVFWNKMLVSCSMNAEQSKHTDTHTHTNTHPRSLTHTHAHAALKEEA